VDELVSQAGTYTIWQVDRPEEALAMFKNGAGIQLIGAGEHQIDESLLSILRDPIISIMDEDQISGWVNKFVASGIGIHSVQRVAPSLEELFLKLTEDEKIG
jgi:ABC-2 type transport system ATP-binding protein